MSSYRRDDVPPPVVTPAAARLSQVLAIGVFQRGVPELKLAERLRATSITVPTKQVDDHATTGVPPGSDASAPIDVDAPDAPARGRARATLQADRARGHANTMSGTSDAPKLRNSHKPDSGVHAVGGFGGKFILAPKGEKAGWTRRADQRTVDEVYTINAKDYRQTKHSGPRTDALTDADEVKDALRPDPNRMPDTGPPNDSRGASDATGKQLSERNDRWRKGLPKESAHYKSYKETIDERALRQEYIANTAKNFTPVDPYPTLEDLYALEVAGGGGGVPSVEERASSRLPPEDNAYTHETGWNLRMCPPLPDDGDEEARNGVLVAWDKANRTMDNLIKRAQELVREQNYFGEEWQFEALDRLRSNLPEDGTNFNRDTFMAKFMIQTHLVCLDMVSEMTRGEAKAPRTDARMRMTESFDLPSLVVNVRKLLRYRLQVLHAREQMLDDNGNFKAGQDLEKLKSDAARGYGNPQGENDDEMAKSLMMIHQELYTSENRERVRARGRIAGAGGGGRRWRRRRDGDEEEDEGEEGEEGRENQGGEEDDGDDEDDDDEGGGDPIAMIDRAMQDLNDPGQASQGPDGPTVGGSSRIDEVRARQSAENDKFVNVARQQKAKTGDALRKLKQAWLKKRKQWKEMEEEKERRQRDHEKRVRNGTVSGDDELALQLAVEEAQRGGQGEQLTPDQEYILAMEKVLEEAEKQHEAEKRKFEEKLKENAASSANPNVGGGEAGPSENNDSLNEGHRLWLEGFDYSRRKVDDEKKAVKAKQKEFEKQKEAARKATEEGMSTRAQGKRKAVDQTPPTNMQIAGPGVGADAGVVMQEAGEEEGGESDDGIDTDDEGVQDVQQDDTGVRMETVAPAELPMLCLAPPRQGKSALIMLMSSFAIKLGGTVLCGVAPNKKIPIAEMRGKLEDNLQWTKYTLVPKRGKRKKRGRKSRVEKTADDSEPESESEPEYEPPEGRDTHQGLEVAMAWSVDEGGVEDENRRKARRLAKEQALQTSCGEQPPADPSSLLPDDQRGTLLWKRLRASGTIVKLGKEKALIDLGKMVNAVTYNTAKDELGKHPGWDHLIGDAWKMMQRSDTVTKTHLFLYSQDTERDTLGAQQVAQELLRGKSLHWSAAGYANREVWKRQWVFHVRDEAQFLCKQSGYVHEEYVCDSKPESGDTYVLATSKLIQEHKAGWKHPPIILDQLRTTYPLMRGLSMCVSGTILPSIVEKHLWGATGLPDDWLGENHPDENAEAKEWAAYYEKWDAKLVAAARSAFNDKWQNPLLVSSLVPPKGRMADYARMPGWIQRNDPDNVDRTYSEIQRTRIGPNGEDEVAHTATEDVGRAPQRTYYGTMQHVVQWDGGDLSKYPNLDHGRGGETGLGKYLSPSMSVLDQAHNTGRKTKLKEEITKLHGAYQNAWRLLNMTGDAIDHPLKRLMLLKKDEITEGTRLSKRRHLALYHIDDDDDAPVGFPFRFRTVADRGNGAGDPEHPHCLARREHESRLRLQACAASADLAEKRKSQNKLLKIHNDVIVDFGLRPVDTPNAVAKPFSHDLEYFRFCGLHYYTPTHDSVASKTAGAKSTNRASQGDEKKRRLMPYRRPMALPLERPSADAVKILCHVKEWLELEAHEEAVPGLGNQNVLSQVFSPMYILSPTRLQNDDNGGIEWARHALKYAWLRMHKDFLRVAPTIKKGVVQPDTGDEMHPYRACKSVEEFRRKYGVVVLVYASNIKEEQALRAALLADVASTARSYAEAFAPSATDGTKKQSGEGDENGRLLSLLFDPALPENRLPQYDDDTGGPPHSWTVNERRTRLSDMMPDNSTYATDGAPPESKVFTVDDQPIEIENVYAWLEATRGREDYATIMSAGTMLNVAHAYRLERHWIVDETIPPSPQGPQQWPIKWPEGEKDTLRVQRMGEFMRVNGHAEKNPDCEWRVEFRIVFHGKPPIDHLALEGAMLKGPDGPNEMSPDDIEKRAPAWIAEKAKELADAAHDKAHEKEKWNNKFKRERLVLSRSRAWQKGKAAEEERLRNSHKSADEKERLARRAGYAAVRADLIESVKYEYFKTAPKDLALHLALRESQMRPWVYKASQIAGEVHIAVSIVFGNRQKAEQAQKNIDDLMRVPTAESPNAAFKKVFGQGDQTNITVETLKDPVHDGNVSTLKTDNAPYYVQYDFDTRAGSTKSRNKFKYLQCAAPIWENVDNLGKWLENEPNNEGISRPSDPFMEKPKPTPLEDLNGIVLRLSVTKWTTAEEAIRTTQKKYNIHKTMVSGYGMLTAGLTIQTSLLRDPEWTSRMLSDPKVGTVDIHWVPRYMAMSATDPGSIDTEYQIIGRSFVDTRHNKLPDWWKVNFLGARTTYPMVKLYSRLELSFAQMENVSLTGALARLIQMMTHPDVVQDDFTPDFMHDVVSSFLSQQLHVSDRADSKLFRFFQVRQAPNRGPPIPIAANRHGYAWHRSMPQHTPKDDAHVVTVPPPEDDPMGV